MHNSNNYSNFFQAFKNHIRNKTLVKCVQFLTGRVRYTRPWKISLIHSFTEMRTAGAYPWVSAVNNSKGKNQLFFTPSQPG